MLELAALLRRLPSLTSLRADRLQVSTLTFLTACPTTLHSLTLADAIHLGDRALQALQLAACPRLTSVHLSRFRALTTVSALSALTELRVVDLTGCDDVTSVAPLQQRPHLATLALGTNVTSLAPLTALTALASLKCANRTITDLASLAPFVATLIRLSFSHSTLADLSPLSRHTRLASLEVEGGSVTSLAHLALLGGSLTRLRLIGCAVGNLRPLASCGALTWPCLDRNGVVADVSPLSCCGALKTLIFGYCERIASLPPSQP